MTAKQTQRPSSEAEGPRWAEEWISLSEVVKLQAWQVREKLDAAAVKSYRARTAAGSMPPPIRVARLPAGALVLIDGWHRIESGALQHECLDSSRVRAEVATLTEAEASWQAAWANTRHGVPLKTREFRAVLRAFIHSGRHRTGGGGRGRLLSYREIGEALGVGHNTIRNWMKSDHSSVFAAMGGRDPSPKPGAGPTWTLGPTPDELAVVQAVTEAQQAAAILPRLTPGQRWQVVQAAAAVVAAAQALPMTAPAPEAF